MTKIWYEYELAIGIGALASPHQPQHYVPLSLSQFWHIKFYIYVEANLRRHSQVLKNYMYDNDKDLL